VAVSMNCGIFGFHRWFLCLRHVALYRYCCSAARRGGMLLSSERRICKNVIPALCSAKRHID
jgi:hypothetical protein